MTNHFQFSVPRTGEADLQFPLGIGEVLYLLGANGTAKSSLVLKLFRDHSAKAKRISAHRQTWFESNTLNMTPHDRASLENNVRSNDSQEQARYQLSYGNQRTSMAIYDLIDSDTMLARKIADLVRAGNTAAAENEAKTPAPLKVINELMRLSNIPIEISIEEGQKIVARKNGGSGYSIAELSDGERNAFLVAADVLTAKPGTLLVIDEPERHLHRSIISPLLKQLFDKRKDCAFIVSTHELMLPLDTPTASTLLVRSCEYDNRGKAWTVDLLAGR
jgi:ABC-type cobalamin/Fe3+-siderophores transport system ATPase subunit